MSRVHSLLSSGRRSLLPGAPARWITLWKEWKTMKNIYVRLLQFLVGTEIDGDWGPQSCAAADRMINELRQLAVQIYNVTREEAPNGNNDRPV